MTKIIALLATSTARLVGEAGTLTMRGIVVRSALNVVMVVDHCHIFDSWAAQDKVCSIHISIGVMDWCRLTYDERLGFMRAHFSFAVVFQLVNTSNMPIDLCFQSSFLHPLFAFFHEMVRHLNLNANQDNMETSAPMI